jgi:SAM-dependent methyltransferase
MTAQETEAIIWEEICCPLCSNGDEDLLLAVPADPAETLYRLVRCRQCGMAYINPRPAAVADSPLSVAPEESASSVLAMGPRQRPSVGGGSRLWLERLILSRYHGYPPPLTHWWEKALAALARPLVRLNPDSLMPLPYVGEGRLLEFGDPLPSSSAGGRGYPSARPGHRLQQRGWDVLTLDASATASEWRVAEGSLDAIVMEGVLAHVHWPHPLIEQAARALRPGGLLAVCVPNLDSWGFRSFGMKWFPLDVPRRLLHFTPGTLKQLVSSHGLEVTEVRFVGRTHWMRRSLQNQFSSGLFAGLLTRWTVWRKQADCLVLLARRRESTTSTVRLAA